MENKQFNIVLIDNITGPLLTINNAIKNTTNLANQLNLSLKNIKLNTTDLKNFNVEIENTDSLIANFLTKTADVVTILEFLKLI